MDTGIRAYLNKYIKHIGLKKETSENRSNKTYDPIDNLETAIRYLDYLKESDHYGVSRGSTIENKISQLIGQSSLVATVFALFVSVLLDKLNDIHFILLLVFSFMFLFVLFHYALSIIHATSTLLINKYQYSRRNTTTVTKDDRKQKELDFVNEEISDLIWITEQNHEMNNRKGDNLIYATRCFMIGNIGFSILAAFIILSSFFLVDNSDPLHHVKVQNLYELQFPFPYKDTTTNQIQTVSFSEYDTLIYQVDSTGRVKIFKAR